MLRVMSFNIRYGKAPDGPNQWSHRRKLVIDRIRSFSPDILGLQECRDDQQADYIKRHLPEYLLFGVHRGGQGEPALEMAPVLVRQDRFHILEWGYFWLSKTPDIPGSVSWGSALPRTVTWVQVESKTFPAGSLTFVNAHFDHFSEVAILESAHVLHHYLDGLGDNMPVILVGDFNCSKNSPAYRVVRSTGNNQLQDALEVNALTGISGTFHDFGRLTEPVSMDWLLVSPHFQVQEAGVDHFHRDRVYPSDHYPVYAVLSRELM